jgi:glucose-6-phosphate isomerase
MGDLKISIGNVEEHITFKEISLLQGEMEQCHEALLGRSGKGNDFLGWLELPSQSDSRLIERILLDAADMQEKAELFVVIGIGGSYLGARAIIEALSNPFHLLDTGRRKPVILYAGHHIGEDYHAELLRLLDRYDYALTVISKSGTTTEPAIAFRLLKVHLEKKYGQEGARERIIAITDHSRGALKKLADEQGYRTYVVPDDVGGRYSVLTPVGLLPVAVAGFDIRQLMAGALDMERVSKKSALFSENPAAMYAATRYGLYQKGKTIEILVNYLPALQYFTEWWKQLYGESEGKEHMGIFPAGVNFTTDLHSMGQYLQEGLRNLFETIITVEKNRTDLVIPKAEDDADGLNYIAGKKLEEVNRMASLGTLFAHVDGGVPVISVSVGKLDEFHLGQLIYFYEFACALSGYMLGVNPFDQPGVEAYKKNMFALLGKKGFEGETERLRGRIGGGGYL